MYFVGGRTHVKCSGIYCRGSPQIRYLYGYVIFYALLIHSILVGTCDPFLQAEFAGLKIKTEKKEGTQNPTFNEVLQIPVSLPIMADDIELTLWDWDAVCSFFVFVFCLYFLVGRKE